MNKKIYITLTSYPERISTVHVTIESLINQNMSCEGVLLWLADTQFPGKEKDLPENLKKFIPFGLIIEWCKDLRSYKKIIFALEKYDNALLVSADDDLIYPSDWLERLINGYKNNPNCLNALRCHRIVLNHEHSDIEKYKNWMHEIENAEPSILNFCTSGGGVVYSKELLDSMYNREDIFLNLCFDADDIWLWAMAVKKGTLINLVKPSLGELVYVKESQVGENVLWKKNIKLGFNDIRLRSIFKYFPDIHKRIIEALISESDYKVINYWTCFKLKVIKVLVKKTGETETRFYYNRSLIFKI